MCYVVENNEIYGKKELIYEKSPYFRKLVANLEETKVK
jgi:hypothetical protein